MVVIKTELDSILNKVNKNYNKKELKIQFLKELRIEDIDSDLSLKCLYEKWLLRYYLK